MPAYLIVNYTVQDPDAYAEYQAGAGPALKVGTDCRLRSFDPASVAVEGNPGSQTVVLEYDSKDEARAAYDSGDYQAVVGIRLGATTDHFGVIVDAIA